MKMQMSTQMIVLLAWIPQMCCAVACRIVLILRKYPQLQQFVAPESYSHTQQFGLGLRLKIELYLELGLGLGVSE